MHLLFLFLAGCYVTDEEYDALYDQDGDGHYSLEVDQGDDCDDQDPTIYGGGAGAVRRQGQRL